MSMEETVKERLTEFIKHQGISKKEFCDAIGVSKAIHKSISDDVKHRIIISYPSLNMDWLIYGKGDMLKEDGEHYRSMPDMDQSKRIELLEFELSECRKQISSLIKIIENISNDKR